MTLGFRAVKVMVIGDIMLDTFVYGHAERLSPEAPVPVILRDNTQIMPGGAANVARNIASLGGNAILVGLAGADQAGADLLRLIGKENIVNGIVCSDERPTTQKTRIVAGSQQVCRLDDESREPPTPSENTRLCREIAHYATFADVIVVSDYAKGVVSDAILRVTLDTGKPVFIDPKSRNWKRYSGAAAIKPNARELSEASSLPCRTEAEIKAAVAKATDIPMVLVTRSEHGMTLIHNGTAISAKSEAQEVYDVSGAGDTVMAAFSLAIGAGWAPSDAMTLSNLAGGIVVRKSGTATVNSWELQAAWEQANSESILPPDQG